MRAYQLKYLLRLVKIFLSSTQLYQHRHTFQYDNTLHHNQQKVFCFQEFPIVAEFLGFKQDSSFSEQELETAIINHLHDFLMELGRGFSFVKRQQLIRTDSQDYFIDLVFYNIILKCYVLIDLKIGKITHQDVGQMDMYRRMYDDLKKDENNNPTIGIVLCSDTDKDIAKYSILNGNEKLFAAKYLPILPTEEELRRDIERQKEIFMLQQQEKEEDKL